MWVRVRMFMRNTLQHTARHCNVLQPWFHADTSKTRHVCTFEWVMSHTSEWGMSHTLNQACRTYEWCAFACVSACACACACAMTLVCIHITYWWYALEFVCVCVCVRVREDTRVHSHILEGRTHTPRTCKPTHTHIIVGFSFTVDLFDRMSPCPHVKEPHALNSTLTHRALIHINTHTWM